MNETANVSPRKVLVADDDPAILRLVTAIVEKEGFEVIPARDGKEAFKLVQETPDLKAAILDVVMPYIQGTELVKFMHEDEGLKHIPVIMMTAEQNPRLSSESFASGAVAFLPKPFTTSQLKVMLTMFILK